MVVGFGCAAETAETAGLGRLAGPGLSGADRVVGLMAHAWFHCVDDSMSPLATRWPDGWVVAAVDVVRRSIVERAYAIKGPIANACLANHQVFINRAKNAPV